MITAALILALVLLSALTVAVWHAFITHENQ